MVNPPLDLKYVFREYIQVFKNRAFRQYFFIGIFYSFSKNFYSDADQVFLRSVVDKYSHFAVLQTIAGVAEVSGGPFNYFLSRYMDKRFCGLALTPFMIAGLLINGFSTAATPVFLIYLASIFYNFGFSGPGFVITNIQPDITDVDELITGRRREGVISTFNSFLKKTSLSLSSGALGYMLHYMGYDPDVADYTKLTSTAEFGIRLAVSWLPAIFMVIALILTFRYKMRKRDHEIIQDVIRQKHETGTCEISDADKERLEEIAGQSWDDMWIGKSEIIKQKQEELANI